MLCIGICDDSYDARFALRSALERLLEPRRQTARILEFSSGEGLLRWQSHHPGELHLVFLDLEMNQLDGMETARRLRRGCNWPSSQDMTAMSTRATRWAHWDTF